MSSETKTSPEATPAHGKTTPASAPASASSALSRRRRTKSQRSGLHRLGLILLLNGLLVAGFGLAIYLTRSSDDASPESLAESAEEDDAAGELAGSLEEDEFESSVPEWLLDEASDHDAQSTAPRIEWSVPEWLLDEQGFVRTHAEAESSATWDRYADDVPTFRAHAKRAFKLFHGQSH